uniref:long-chain-fatty-acid--CoA ligase n=1 Tax=Panagrellus redivivus TaxID=6233 RepID=A0A7E4W1B1_PANRE
MTVLAPSSPPTSPRALLLPDLPRFETYSRVLPGAERIHESVLTVPGTLNEGLPDSSVKTLFDLLQRGIRVSGNGELIGERVRGNAREYAWTRYELVASRAQKAGSGLIALGLQPGQATRVGIAGVNSTEYLIATFGIVNYSMISVPLYHNYKFEAIKEIVNKCNLKIIFADTLERAKLFIDAEDELQTLEKIIVFSEEEKGIQNGKSDQHRIEVYEWNYLLTLGEANLLPPVPPKPDDVYIICNTSGTTGKPKGVMLSHKALLTSVGGLYHQWCVEPNCLVFDDDDTYLSFLSPAHIYEQLIQCFIIYIGGRIGLYGGDIAKLVDDMQVLQPTIVSLVPRLLNKFHDAIHAKVSQANWLKRLLFRMAISAKTKHLKRGVLRYDTFWDRWVLASVRQIFGGKLRLVTSGGAPITAKIMNFSKIIYGCPLVEGYGQSECSAAGTLSMPSDTGNGHVGGPAPWAQVKLVDVAELEYRASEDKGEVCFRGAALMSGYFDEPELTAAAIDSQGWLHTGDIGSWLPNGALQIIDRKNNFFKLAQGDFVSPEQVENIYGQHPLVNQVFVTGKTTESFLVAIVVINQKVLEAARSTNASTSTDLENPETAAYVVEELRILGASKGLSSIEQIKAAHLTTEEFTVEGGFLTPTLKLKRQPLKVKYEKVIDAMYENPSVF